jgi:hypothetical protein
MIRSVPTQHSSTTTVTKITTHHKRRQWNFNEKLKIISEFNKGVSLHALELKYKCTRKMIRQWKKNENQLIKMVKDNGGKGKKRKRIDGAGAKLTYYDLDEHLHCKKKRCYTEPFKFRTLLRNHFKFGSKKIVS